jgi:transcriptional regulator with XRE-family HTH domain
MPSYTTIDGSSRERRLSQKAVADLAGVSLNVIKAIERGNTNIRFDLLLRVLDLFGIELEMRG